MQRRRGEIILTSVDQTRLLNLAAERAANASGPDVQQMRRLQEEIKRATIVEPNDIPSDVVTLHSSVELTDLDNGSQRTMMVVMPDKANLEEQRVSVLAPVGMALLGYASGDEVQWETPGGLRRFRIGKVLYQPEAAGVYRPDTGSEA